MTKLFRDRIASSLIASPQTTLWPGLFETVGYGRSNIGAKNGFYSACERLKDADEAAQNGWVRRLGCSADGFSQGRLTELFCNLIL
jgi:hypothetical protein